MADVLDYQAQHYLRRFIRRLGSDQQRQLKTLYYCGQKINLHYRDYLDGKQRLAFLLTDNAGHARFHGESHCRNPWCCPVCSAKEMERYREKIASAIDMMKAKGYFGFMATFTVAHHFGMSFRMTADILYNTWSYFRKKNFNKKFHPFQLFCEDTGMQDWVRVCESTFSRKSSWHPHFHCIFWVKREDAHKVLAWEAKLNEFWIKVAKRETLKYWQKCNHMNFFKDENHKSEDAIKRIDTLYGMSTEKAIFFSKDKQGSLLEATSANYSTGWTMDREVTGNVRKQASHAQHETPYQILCRAMSGDVEAERIYMRYCLDVTRKPVHHRVNFSKNGFSARVEKYHKAQLTRRSELLEKKSTWEVVAYFDEAQWYELSCLDRDAPVFANMLYLAAHYKYLLGDYLDSLGIKLMDYKPQEALELEDRFNAPKYVAG